MEDWLALIDAATKGYGEGLGLLSKPKAYELLRDGRATKFDPAEAATQTTTTPVEIPLDIIARRKKRETPPAGRRLE